MPDYKVPTGYVEPHAHLLEKPPREQRLYKVMSVENLLRSVAEQYLYFNRVDRYKDFPSADAHDGEQLPRDRIINEKAKFEKAPEYSHSDSCDTSRSRTYACCFSLENSDHIWSAYGNSGQKGKVCLVFRFEKLREMLNAVFENSETLVKGYRCKQIFSINYGLIRYVDWEATRTSENYLANPILYTYIKDERYGEERELRISLSAVGIGKFAVNGDVIEDLGASLQLSFDFRRAIAAGVIEEIKHLPDTDVGHLQRELENLGISRAPGCSAPI